MRTIMFVVGCLLSVFVFGQTPAELEDLRQLVEQNFNATYSVVEDGVTVQKKIVDVVFHAFHPIGDGKKVVVHELKLVDAQYKATNNLDKVCGIWARATVYWRSPLIDEGYTKFTFVFDQEIGKFVQIDLVATNGTINEEFNYKVGFGIGCGIGALLFGGNNNAGQ